MSKTFLEIFSKYEPDASIRTYLDAAQESCVKCDRERRIIEIETKFSRIIPKSILYKIESQLAQSYKVNIVKILPKYPGCLLTYEYIPEILKEAERTGVVARGFFSDYTYEFDGEKLSVCLNTLPGGIDLMNDFKTPQVIDRIIFSEFGAVVKTELSCSSDTAEYSERIRSRLDEIDRELTAAEKIYDERERESFRERYAEETVPADEVKEVKKLPRVTTIFPEKKINNEAGVFDSGCRKFDISNPEYVFGEEFDVAPKRIADIKNTERGVVIAGDVFGFECEKSRGGDKYNLTFSLTDYNSSIEVKCFGLTEEESEKISGFISDGASVALYGAVKRETRKGVAGEELYMTFQNAAKIKRIDRTDDADEKRVELHIHTSMSTMDAIISPPDLIKTAKNWGYSAIAVTDHANLQAYPEVMIAAEAAGVKPIYGVEGYFVNDTASAVYGLENKNQPGFDDEFIVFDIETTGLSAQNCKITEIGAVRVAHGKICETFGTYADPGEHIPEEITKLTGITDEMVSGAPSQADAVRLFLEFTGDRMLVAHNANFDMGFIRTVCEKNCISFTNPYLDTVALSRYINKDLKNHRLDTLAKYYSLREFNHHRAYDDASMLAEIFICMIAKMRSLDIHNFEELAREMSENSDPLKLKTYHQIILVKNQAGLKNLYRIISESYLKYFYRTPRIPKTLLEKYRDGLIVGSACEAGEIYSAFLENKPESEIESLAEFYDYLEIQPVSNNHFLVEEGQLPNDDAIRDINRRIYELGKRLGKPVVATCDAHFINEEDEIFRKILLTGMKFKDADRDCHIYLRTTAEMIEEFSYLGSEAAYEVVVKNTNLISGMIENVRPIPKGSYTPSMEGAEEELQDMCWKRARSMYGDELPEIVSKRLDKELTSIIKHGFAVLYIIAQRLVKFSEDNGYLVGSRGSVGSSFVATMAGISEVNPLPPHYWCPGCRYNEFFTDGSVGSGFDLPDKICPRCGRKLNADGHDIPFETFLGFYGDKSPDIDLNFSGDIQAKVHKYTEELFGSDNVFRAGTLGTLADKTAYGFVAKYVESKGVSIPRAEMNRFVNNCVGVKRTTGQHPGGIIVIPREYEVYDFTPIQHPADDPKSDVITTHFAFSYLHDTILKLDELGHDIPTKYKWLERFSNTSVLDVPMNDKDVYELFASTKSLGVKPDDIGSQIGTFGLPEFGTGFVQPVVIESKPKNFADLLQVSGLTHGTDVWLGNAQDLIKNNICTISKVVGTRDGIMLDLIRYGLENSKAFKIMEFVRKNKKGKPLPDDMVAAMKEKNVPDWYIDSLRKIKYMFPKAHAAAYVMSAIRLGWYKVHMPLAFYCAMFTVAPGGFDAEIVMKGKRAVVDTIADIEKRKKSRDSTVTQKEEGMIPTLQLVNECFARNIKFLKVDLKKSDAFAFLPENGAIRMPFSSLGGLGETAAQNIITEREKEPFFSVEDLRIRAGLTKSVIEILRRNGVLDNLSETDQITISF